MDCTNSDTQGGSQHDKVDIGQNFEFEIFSLSYHKKFT